MSLTFRKGIKESFLSRKELHTVFKKIHLKVVAYIFSNCCGWLKKKLFQTTSVSVGVVVTAAAFVLWLLEAAIVSSSSVEAALDSASLRLSSSFSWVRSTLLIPSGVILAPLTFFGITFKSFAVVLFGVVAEIVSANFMSLRSETLLF